MDVKDAVKAAKTYVADVFSEENLSNLGLEEVEHDEAKKMWFVTVGFSRPWNTTRNALTAISGDPNPQRAYRIVSLNDNGEVISIKRRDVVSD